MIKLSITGYVNNVRSNTLKTGKKVTNIRLGVEVGKKDDKKVYQTFDVAFWDNWADQASQVKEKDYVHIPDVVLSNIEISQEKYINIKGSANVIFKGLERVAKAPEEDPTILDNGAALDDLPY